MSRAVVILSVGVLAVVVLMSARAEPDRCAAGASSGSPSAMNPYAKPPPDAIKKKLTARQYDVVCNEGTEPPFQNAFWDNHEAGLYVDVVTGEPLFSSTDKFDSGTGWPSFTRPVDRESVVERTDHKLLLPRTEVRSKGGDSHLGHVFEDGPGLTGLRYCINSASLRFIPVDKLEAEGYGQHLPLFGKAAAGKGDGPRATAEPKAEREIATLAGGCFWGMEDLLRQIPGVIETRVGYTGGTTERATYPDVKTGRTGHAESVEITFDPSKLSFADLLEKHFFRMHDPTTPSRQGNDVGSQYRSAIFVRTPEQRRAAEAAKVNAQARWKRPIVTEVVDAGPFWSAEEYHQKYLVKNPGGYTCHYVRD